MRAAYSRPCGAGAVEAGLATAVAEAPRLVRCGACGGDFELSARRVRHVRAESLPLRCRSCRTGRVTPEPTEAHRRWWLDRFTVDEIREMAAALWPDAQHGQRAGSTPAR